jgi:F-type H+-transporting ATPase subunit delta
VAIAHRIYAEALLQAAKHKGRVEGVRQEFGDLAAAVSESDELAELLRNPQLDSRAKGAALDAVLVGADEIFRNFIRLTAEKNRIGELVEIHDEWERLLAAEARVLAVELTTAVELSDEEADRLVGQIEQASGRTVVATRKVDPSLIGGLILQAGSLRLDASVRGRLDRLRHQLRTRR